MTLLTIALASIAALIALTYLLPKSVTVTRDTLVPVPADQILNRVASTDGFQTFNPYHNTDPDLSITPFGPASGVGSGFRFEGKEGKGTQTVIAVTATSVTHQIDLGAMGQPVQVISAQPEGEMTRVSWAVTSDFGYNPVFRIFGLFLDRMLGGIYERGLQNLKSAA